MFDNTDPEVRTFDFYENFRFGPNLKFTNSKKPFLDKSWKLRYGKQEQEISLQLQVYERNSSFKALKTRAQISFRNKGKCSETKRKYWEKGKCRHLHWLSHVWMDLQHFPIFYISHYNTLISKLWPNSYILPHNSLHGSINVKKRKYIGKCCVASKEYISVIEGTAPPCVFQTFAHQTSPCSVCSILQPKHIYHS